MTSEFIPQAVCNKKGFSETQEVGFRRTRVSRLQRCYTFFPMTPPRVDQVNYMIAMSAFGYKKCRCGRQKVRDVEAICEEYFAKLSEPMQRGLKDKTVYRRSTIKSANSSPSGKTLERNSIKDGLHENEIFPADHAPV